MSPHTRTSTQAGLLLLQGRRHDPPKVLPSIVPVHSVPAATAIQNLPTIRPEKRFRAFSSWLPKTCFRRQYLEILPRTGALPVPSSRPRTFAIALEINQARHCVGLISLAHAGMAWREFIYPVSLRGLSPYTNRTSSARGDVAPLLTFAGEDKGGGAL